MNLIDEIFQEFVEELKSSNIVPEGIYKNIYNELNTKLTISEKDLKKFIEGGIKNFDKD